MAQTSRAMLAVSVELRERLYREMERMVEAIEDKRCRDIGLRYEALRDDQLPLTVEVFLNHLINQRQLHRQRCRVASRKRKGKRRRPSKAAVGNAGRDAR